MIKEKEELADEALANVFILTPEDIAYLHQIEEATLRGFAKLFDPATGLPVDIALIQNDDLLRQPANINYSKTSPTNIALAFLYLLLAEERGYLTETQAYHHALQMLGVLEMLETYQGFHFNWYYLSGKSGKIPEVTLNRFVSSIDNGNLDIALMCVAGHFDETALARRIERFLVKRDYRSFFNKNPLKPDSEMMSLGFDVEAKAYSASDYSIFNTEGRMMVLVSILKDNVPESAWKKQARLVRNYVTLEGETIPVVAPWGGSLFEGLFADEIVGGNRTASRAFQRNALNLIRIHQDKGRRISESGIWGFSNGEVPGENRYEMLGVNEIAYSQFPGEFVTVYSSFLALKYDSKSVIENLRKIESLNPESFSPNFGFVESIDPKTGVINQNILSLDKGMEFLALGNFLNRLDGKKEISDYFWAYLKTRFWHRKAEKLLKEEEGHPSFLALSETSSRLKARQEAVPVFILGLEKDMNAFAQAGKAKAEFEVIETEAGRTICILYDVNERYSFAGVSIRLSEINIESFSQFIFEARGSKELGIPKTLKVELKWRGELVQFEHVAATEEWRTVSVPLPPSPHAIDEIAVVFENSSVGEARGGEVCIRLLRLQ